MKDRRHRIATRKGDEFEWGWTATPVSGAYFAVVDDNGSAHNGGASYSFGIRPLIDMIMKSRIQFAA